MKKIYSVDRFEGEYAVVICDDESVLNIKRKELPDFCEGDVFGANIKNGILCDIVPMPEEREKREHEARERLQRLFSGKNKT